MRMSKKPFWELTPNRECGECSLCCKLVLVREDETGFLKPEGAWCQHSTKTSCKIYDERPKPCRGFSCVWLQGAGDDKHRPDRAKALGFGVERRYKGEKHILFEIYEAIPLTCERGAAADLVRAALENPTAILIIHGARNPRTLITAPGAVTKKRRTETIPFTPGVHDAPSRGLEIPE
jgi:hypothetical protein